MATKKTTKKKSVTVEAEQEVIAEMQAILEEHEMLVDNIVAAAKADPELLVSEEMDDFDPFTASLGVLESRRKYIGQAVLQNRQYYRKLSLSIVELLPPVVEKIAATKDPLFSLYQRVRELALERMKANGFLSDDDFHPHLSKTVKQRQIETQVSQVATVKEASSILNSMRSLKSKAEYEISSAERSVKANEEIILRIVDYATGIRDEVLKKSRRSESSLFGPKPMPKPISPERLAQISGR